MLSCVPFIERETIEKLYHKENFSIREIADVYKCDKSTIHRRMIEYGIVRRQAINGAIRGKIKHCKSCNSEMPFHSKYKICKKCWAKKNGRERYPNGYLVSKKVRPFSKREQRACKRCRNKIAYWNKTGYCTSCWNLPGMKKHIENIFCKSCGKAITGHGKTSYCLKCAKNKRRKEVKCQ